VATVLPGDDALARQRRIIAWHPLRALNAINVRVLGADLVTVHVRLMAGGSTTPAAASIQDRQSLAEDYIAAPGAGLPVR
jgi:hypothetical protein